MRIHETANAFINKNQILDGFIDYWKAHNMVDTVSNGSQHPPEDDILQNIKVDDDGTINTNWKISIRDHQSEKFPFKLGRVRGLRLQMNKLTTYENLPHTIDTHFIIERSDDNSANNVLTSLAGCPSDIKHLAFEIARPLENLVTGLTSPIEDIWIEVPEVKSFAGLNVQCTDMSILTHFQKSITGIHKQLRNVTNLTIGLPPNFQGGLLCLAMIPGLQMLGPEDLSVRNNVSKAILIISGCMKKKMNVHDIQEELIEAQLNQFATL